MDGGALDTMKNFYSSIVTAQFPANPDTLTAMMATARKIY
jgi:hypothetical protein